MKKILLFLSFQLCSSCKDIQQSRWSFILNNKSNQDITLYKYNTFLNKSKEFIVKRDEKIEFSSVFEVLNGIPPDADSIVITFNNKKIIDCCKSPNSENCQKIKSFYSANSYVRTVDESRRVLKSTYSYEFTNDDLKRGK